MKTKVISTALLLSAQDVKNVKNVISKVNVDQVIVPGSWSLHKTHTSTGRLLEQAIQGFCHGTVRRKDG